MNTLAHVKQMRIMNMKPLPTKTYVVAYCRAPDDDDDRDWGPFYYALQSSKSSARPFRSVWVVETSRQLDELAAILARHLRGEDKLLVVECGPRATWVGLGPVMADWFADRFEEPRGAVLDVAARERPLSRLVGRMN